MRLLLHDTRQHFLIHYRHRNSLLPFWVYWPRYALFFAFAFVRNAVVGVVKDHLLAILFYVGVIVIGHTSFSQAREVGVTTVSTIIEIVGGVLFVIVLVLYSHDMTTGRTKKNKVSYSRKVNEDEE